MVVLDLPTSEEAVRALAAGDQVLLRGELLTARDAAHKYLVARRPEFLEEKLRGTMIYHCGPIMRRAGQGWEVVAAGPTTSIREEPYEAEVIATYGVRGVIGKGGMGAKTSEALQRCGAVYLAAVGGAAAVLARCVVAVRAVHLLEELGPAEALWEMEVRDFPATVTMDSRGRNLYEEVARRSAEVAGHLLPR